MASIVKRTTTAGVRYDVRFRVNGEQRKKSFRRRADADAYRRTVEGDELAGAVIDPRAGSATLAAYVESWLSTRLVRGRALTPATVSGYRGLLRRHILDDLGPVQLRAITPARVREWHAGVTERAGSDQAAKAYRLLRAVLSTAESDDLIRVNPCRIRGGGQERAAERPMVPTSLVLDLAEAMPERYRALVLLAGFGGLRTGESLGLRRVDVDPLHATVRVVEQAQEVTGRGRVTLEPKSDAGKRTVSLPVPVAVALDEHLAAYTGPAPTDPVFTCPTGTPLRRATLSSHWRAAVAATGAPPGLHLHDLRHHAATIVARMPGVTTKELMARIGHSSPRAALIYQHATAERDQAIAAYLGEQMAGAERPQRAPVVPLGASGCAMDVPSGSA